MFVYVIECEGRIKIGKASKPRSRLSNMQVACPFPMRLRATAQFSDLNSAANAERMAHAKFQSGRIGGEWFSADVDEVVKYLASLGGTVKDLSLGPRVRTPNRWSTRDKESLVSYLETQMTGMSDVDVLRLAQVHGKSTSDRHELAGVIAEKHVNRQ